MLRLDKYITWDILTTTMSHQLTDDFWDLLGPEDLFQCKLFHKQSKLIAQLQIANNAIEDQVMQAQDDITDAATKAVSAVAQAILGNSPAVSHLSWTTKAVEPENIYGS